MKRLLLIFSLCCLVLTLAAQKRYAVYGVGFYNLENLFDTCHDEGKNDYEYLPDGKNKWNGLKYTNKLANMSRALADMGTEMLPVGCAVIGVSEVENARALTDLVNQPPLKERNFQFVHIDGPDRRGVDCALLYNPRLFKVDDVKLHIYKMELPQDSLRAPTRGFLAVSGQMGGEHVGIIVCHWPSRFTGGFYRESGARQAYAVKDSMLRADPQCKVFVMGDMNDDPTNLSMTKYMHCKAEIDDVEEGDMYNPWYNVLVKQGTGTLMYQGKWNLFDQIVLSPNLLIQKHSTDAHTLKYFRHKIQAFPYLFQTEGRYKGSPLRTHAGGTWLNGYSDHLPVVVYVRKEIQ